MEDITAFTKAEDIKQVKPVTLSFSRDIEANQNNWIAKGAVMRPFVFNDRSTFAPSITFNRVASKDTSKAANSFVPKLGFYRRNQKGIYRTFINYATDFDFKSSQIGIELEWEPIFFNAKGQGVYFMIERTLPIEFRWFGYLHGEYGYIIDKGNKENLQQDNTYFRVGAKVGVDLRFFDALEFSNSMRYLYGIISIPIHNTYYTSSLIYNFGSDKNLAFKLEYQKGNVPLTSEDVETLVFGVGVKF